MLSNVVCLSSLGVCGSIVSLCSGCVGCRALCLTCEVVSVGALAVRQSRRAGVVCWCHACTRPPFQEQCFVLSVVCQCLSRMHWVTIW